jgi:hypothetical protein
VNLVVARDHDVVEVDIDGDAGNAGVVHGCSSRRVALMRIS